MALRAGRPREDQQMERVEAPNRRGAGAARHEPDAEERRESEGLHGYQGVLLVAGVVRGRHPFAPQAGQGDLPRAAGGALSDRHGFL